jgi:DNA replication initiation complex subunit (GINS family)
MHDGNINQALERSDIEEDMTTAPKDTETKPQTTNEAHRKRYERILRKMVLQDEGRHIRKMKNSGRACK